MGFAYHNANNNTTRSSRKARYYFCAYHRVLWFMGLTATMIPRSYSALIIVRKWPTNHTY